MIIRCYLLPLWRIIERKIFSLTTSSIILFKVIYYSLNCKAWIFGLRGSSFLRINIKILFCLELKWPSVPHRWRTCFDWSWLVQLTPSFMPLKLKLATSVFPSSTKFGLVLERVWASIYFILFYFFFQSKIFTSSDTSKPKETIQVTYRYWLVIIIGR